MAKKIVGYLFFVGAAILILSSIITGSLFEDRGSSAETYGYFVGQIFPIVVYVLSGIFFLTFDKALKLNYIDGFKKRTKQITNATVFAIVYGLMMLIVAMGIGASGTDNFVLSYIVGILPYVIPLMAFDLILSAYAKPVWTCKKHFVTNDMMLDEYISANETFYTYSSDNSVLASGKVLFLHKLFCIIPLEQIESIKPYNSALEKGLYLNLNNGKKIYIVTKQYEEISVAIAANKNNNL